ncbi:MAG TPA: hypothetical protein VFG63_07980 [Nocardioidaceae bacterium]|nr:hypothetical protein [Nocardioidaceae bacterium]
MQGWQVKRMLNAVNGSTLLGLGIAGLGRAQVQRGPRGLLLATGYRIGFPDAAAFTVGNVIVSRHDRGWFDRRPRLVRHEERHSWQYVACLGAPMLPLYLLAAGYSYLRGGDVAVHNPFERLAGLEDGGYPLLSRRERRRREPAA